MSVFIKQYEFFITQNILFRVMTYFQSVSHPYRHLNFPMVMQTCTLSQTGGIQPNQSNTVLTVFHQGAVKTRILKITELNSTKQLMSVLFLNLLKEIY